MKICAQCGAELPDGARFCMVCGEAQPLQEVDVQTNIAGDVTGPALTGQFTGPVTVYPPPAEACDPDELRRCYLSELARDANRLPWTIVEQEYAHPERGEGLGLAEVYTALDTTELERVEREEDLRRFLAQVARDETGRIPAQAMVNRENRLVILGDPGSGKSTFVKHLAYTLAQAGLAEDPAPWLERMAPWDHGARLPVRVELRALAAYAEGERARDHHLLLGYLHHQLGEGKLDEFWSLLDDAVRGGDGDRNENEDGGETLVVLLDGLDEVPAGLRGRIVGAVQDFADRYRRHRYVVTCRPYAYVGQPCRLRGFREVTLAPFSGEQIDHFIETWYRELARRERMSAQKAETQAAQMQRAVRRGDLRGLAQRPLLLTVMTLLHTFRGQLPQDRTELYADAVDLLLRRWEGRMGLMGEEEGLLERLDVPGLKMSDLEAGLYNIAYRAHSQAGAGDGGDGGDGAATADVDEGDLRKWLAPYLGGDWNKAGAFVDYIRERAGLLIRHKTEAYTFPHRTFQEFMAACHLVGMGDYPGQAARLAREDLARWREVFALAAGHAARTHRLVQAISAVNALCPREVGSVSQPEATDAADRRRSGTDACSMSAMSAMSADYRRAQLAGASLLEIGLIGVRREEAGQAALARVRGWLTAAMRADAALEPQGRAEAGDTLARLGDARFRADAWHLPDEPLLGFVEIPAGPFVMGEGDDGHELTLPTYYIARYPVTVAQFRAFVETSGYEPRDRDSLRGVDTHPVVDVTWHDALAYCDWLTERLREWAGTPQPLATLLREEGWTVTLPSEAEWEKAARGGREVPNSKLQIPNQVSKAQGPMQRPGWVENPSPGRAFPWGEGADPNRANYEDTGIGTTSAVSCFPGGASPYGVEDLSGNVWEWTRSLYEDYPYDPEDGRENLEAGESSRRVLRGGAFDYLARRVRCAYRLRYDPDVRFRDLGLRVVVSPFRRAQPGIPLDAEASGL